MKKSLINTMLDDLSLFTFKEHNRMKTDIKEFDNHYLFEIDLAGFNKDDINIHVEDNYMIVEANKICSQEYCDNNENYQYVRKERYAGSTSRSYYVGEVVEKDIKASFNNGLLIINIPKEKDNDNKKTKIKID